MKKQLLNAIALPLIVLVLSSGCAQPQPSPAPTPTLEKTPAEFKVLSVDVTPIVAEPGQPVTVKVGVMNVGETEGFYALTLTVNGVDEEVKDVLVAPGASETVAFTLVRDASGIYEIEVAGLTETLRVKQPGAYPRLGNFYVGGLVRSYESARALAKWDSVVVAFTNLDNPYHRGYVKLVKELNPNIKILVSVLAQYNPTIWSLFQCRPEVHEDWLLHHPGTEPPEERRVVLHIFEEFAERYGVESFKVWYTFNPSSDWSTYLPHWVHDEVMSTGLFDGVFYDCVFDAISWLGNIDIDNDGIADSPAVVDREYQKGMTQLLKLTRELLGPEAIILGNPGVEWGQNSPYLEYANGFMQENALGTMFGNSSWSEVWNAYQRNMQKPSPPSRMHWIAADTDMNDFGNVNVSDFPPWALQRMRFGLATTLLGDGYFSFCLGTEYDYQLWWFPEYDANLGLAEGDAQRHSDGTWMREFENGVVIANPNNRLKSTVEFDAVHKDVTTDIKGLHFTIPPQDGRIFVIEQ